MSYTKLDSGIIQSSLWEEDDATRIVWITLLALADANGMVRAAVPAIASLSRVSLKKCIAAIEKFKAPDPYSRTKLEEGRRVLELEDGGFFLVTHEEYRNRRDPEVRLAQVREAVARHRSKSKDSEGKLEAVIKKDYNGLHVITGNQGKPKQKQKQKQRIQTHPHSACAPEIPVLVPPEPPATAWPTLEEAKGEASLRNIPNDCVEKWWFSNDSRLGNDQHGQSIDRWRSSLGAYAVGWRNTEAKDAARRQSGAHRTHQPHQPMTIDDLKC
jgi:hypothetical protein